MSKVVNKVMQKELKYDNTVILTYKIEYPQIAVARYEKGKIVFNKYNEQRAIKLRDYCETELFEQAKKTYQYNKENGYPIMIYEVILEYTVTYNRDEFLSMYADEYEYTGGAHGITTRSSQNWNLKIAVQVPLKDFYPNNPYYLLDILQEINKQIEEQLKINETQYFEDYCKLVLETFKIENYYFYPEYLVVFFQQYDIAPYSSGIPTFKIGYFQR